MEQIKNMTPKTIVIVVSVYQYLMLILVSVFFLVPGVSSHQYFNSPMIDIVARCILWFYFVGSYFSIAKAIKNRVNKKDHIFSMISKNFTSLVLLGISAVVTGAFLSFLTKWSLTAFAPQLPSELMFIISLVNGTIYAILILSQYYFLPVE